MTLDEENKTFFRYVKMLREHEETLAELLSFAGQHIGGVMATKKANPIGDNKINLFSDEELRQIIMSYLATCKDGATEEEIMNVIDWCVDARVNHIMLSMVLEHGFLIVRTKDGDIAIRQPKEQG